MRSVTFVFLIKARSTSAKPGPTKEFRPTVPKVPAGGVMNTVGSTNQLPSGFPVTTGVAFSFGRTVATPVMVLEDETMLNGLPLCKLTIGAIDHPLTMRLALNGRS